MNRRTFLKSGLSAGTVFLLNPSPKHVFSWVFDRSAYAPGEKIAEEAFVLDKELKQLTLLELCGRTGAPVNLLYIYGGGAHQNRRRLGGIWCRDSFEDFYILRYLHEKYDSSAVQMIPVAVPPVYASSFYGFEQRVFLDEPAGSEKFKESAMAFVESTEQAVLEDLIPVATYYDIRNRLLFNQRNDLKPGDGYGKIYSWQGKFRSDEETQKYGTPTVWMLSPDGVVLEPPFWGNIYHGNPHVRYTIPDIEQAIQKHF